jgi:two-component system chemotaxis response regulator CheY
MSILLSSQILIVDNSSPAREIVRKLLTKIGYKNIDEVSDGAAALTKISEKKYDLVISEWNSSPIDGRAFLTQLRADRKYDNLSVIIMSANSAINKVVQASHAGANGFIGKPFDAEALQAKISEIIIK